MAHFPKINASLALLLLFCFGALCITFSFFHSLSFPESDYNFLGKSGQVKLSTEGALQEKFTATRNDLSSVKVLIEKFDLSPGEEIIFSLADDSCQSLITTKRATFLTPKPHSYYRFTFPSIPDSEGKEYCLKISYLSQKEKKGNERPAIETSKGDIFQERSFFNTANGKNYPEETLKIRPAYSNGNTFQNLQELGNRLSEYKAPFFKGAGLLFLVVASLLGTLLLSVWIAFSKDR